MHPDRRGKFPEKTVSPVRRSLRALVVVGFLACVQAQEPPTPQSIPAPTELKIKAPLIKGRLQRFVDWAVGLMTGKGENHIRVYFPALSTDPNSGATLGFMPIWLLQDQQKNIRQILAPSLTYNRIFGVTPTFRYYYYPHSDAQLFVIGSKSTTTNERETVRYIDPHWADFIYVKVEVTHEIDGSNRFFGIGSNTPTSAQSTYTIDQFKTLATLGVDLPFRLDALLTTSFRRVSIQDGPLGNELPQIRSSFPGDVPMTHVDIVTERFSFSRDSRDSTVTPTEGTYFEVYGEISRHALGSEPEFTRYGFEGRVFLPHREGTWVSAFRYLYGLQTGSAPFFEQFWLGGSDLLRGYGDGRFVDRSISLFNFEERIRFYRMKAFGVNTDFEFTPFFDLGAVHPSFSHMSTGDYHPVGGFGVRAVVKPTVVGYVDVGYGGQGTATFVGIDYPF